MDFSSLVNGKIASFLPYRMGKPMEIIKEELGCKNLLRLNAGENPFGMSRKVSQLIKERLDRVPLYPDASAYTFKHTLAQLYGYALNHICAGADNTELISLLTRAFLNEHVNAIVPQVSSLSLERAVTISGAQLIKSPITEEWLPDINAVLSLVNSSTRMILLSNPSNPLGAFMTYSEIERLLKQLSKQVIVVVDEELVDFIGDGYKDLYSLIAQYPNLVIVRSFSHAYGLADLRVGYMLSGDEITGIVNVLRDPFNVSQLSLDCASVALEDQSFISMVLNSMQTERNRYHNFCVYYGLPILQTKTCSVTIDFGEQASAIYGALLRFGIFTRPLHYFALPSLINISIGHPKENDYVLARLEKLIIELFPHIAQREAWASKERKERITAAHRS